MGILSVRLNKETLDNIEKAIEYLNLNSEYDGLRLTNGFAINKEFSNYATIDDGYLICFASLNLEFGKPTIKTNLTISERTKNNINDLIDRIKMIGSTKKSCATTSYVINLMILNYLNNNGK